MNILFYGNCQLFAIINTLNLSNNFKIKLIECWKEDINKANFTAIISKSHVIITQPINDNYRDTDYLSTSYIIKNANSNCKIIIFDSCHFDFYYFDLTYKYFNNDILHKPIDYHYNKMIECYNNGTSVSHYIDEYVNNIDLKSSEELNQNAENSLNTLQERYNTNKNKYNSKNCYIISTYEFIKNNYKNKLLFYSMNHPTKYVIQFICEQIVSILQIKNTINYIVDILDNPKCILYKCIQKNVNFDINQCKPLMNTETDINKITQIYYDTYKEIGLS